MLTVGNLSAPFETLLEASIHHGSEHGHSFFLHHGRDLLPHLEKRSCENDCV